MRFCNNASEFGPCCESARPSLPLPMSTSAALHTWPRSKRPTATASTMAARRKSGLTPTSGFSVRTRAPAMTTSGSAEDWIVSTRWPRRAALKCKDIRRILNQSTCPGFCTIKVNTLLFFFCTVVGIRL